MIDIIKQTPLEYSKESRDYQVLARLYTSLFNVSKMYIDNLQIWNSDIDNKLATLRAKTLNFQTKHNWDLKDLEAITAGFKYLMRYKGTTEAVKIILSIIMKIEKIDNKINGSSVVLNNNCLNIKIEKDLMSAGIIEDLLRYILPAGITYRIIRYVSYDDSSSKVTDVYFVSNSSSDVTKKDYSYSKNLYIGNDESKIRKYDETFIYGDNGDWETAPEDD
jgi:hypothetical protein